MTFPIIEPQVQGLGELLLVQVCNVVTGGILLLRIKAAAYLLKHNFPNKDEKSALGQV